MKFNFGNFGNFGGFSQNEETGEYHWTPPQRQGGGRPKKMRRSFSRGASLAPVSYTHLVCHGISRVRVATWEMVKTPPVAAFSTFHLKYTNPEPLFSGYPSVQASAPQSGQVFPAARSSSM